MIPIERDNTMLVTMTKGELAELMGKIATDAAEKAVKDIVVYLSDVDGRGRDADTLVGGEAIANAIGVNRDTMYKLRRKGMLGDAVRQLGGRNGKLIALRSELMQAIKENQV